MPIGTLVFNLPEEKQEHQFALHGVEYAIAIQEFNEFLMFKLEKSGWLDRAPTAEDMVKLIRDEWNERKEVIEDAGGKCW